MTQRLTQDRLSELALLTTGPSLPPRRLIVALQWTIDAETARPVGRWVLSEDPGTPAL
jgi:hypothetical protein